MDRGALDIDRHRSVQSTLDAKAPVVAKTADGAEA
jgi:hypothetical protein